MTTPTKKSKPTTPNVEPPSEPAPLAPPPPRVTIADITTPYIVEVAFRTSRNGMVLQFLPGQVLKDRLLIADLINCGFQIRPIVEDQEYISCPSCAREVLLSETPTGESLEQRRARQFKQTQIAQQNELLKQNPNAFMGTPKPQISLETSLRAAARREGSLDAAISRMREDFTRPAS